MSRHYQALARAAVLATEDLLDVRDLIGEITAAVAMGAIYGPAGTGKSFAVDEAVADRAEADYVRTDFRARPTMRYVRQELARLLGVNASSGAFEADWALKRALSERFRLVIIDEAQWLGKVCVFAIGLAATAAAEGAEGVAGDLLVAHGAAGALA